MLTVDATGLVTAVKAGHGQVDAELTRARPTRRRSPSTRARPASRSPARSWWISGRPTPATMPTTGKTGPIPDSRTTSSASGAPAYVANVDGTGVAGVQLSGTRRLPTRARRPRRNSTAAAIARSRFGPTIPRSPTRKPWSPGAGAAAPTAATCRSTTAPTATYGAVGHWGGSGHGLVGHSAGRAVALPGVHLRWGGHSQGVRGRPPQDHPDHCRRLEHPCRPAHPHRRPVHHRGADPDFGQALSGYLALVRVHTGKLSDADVENNFLFGPTLTPPGELQTVTLQAERDHPPGRTASARPAS